VIDTDHGSNDLFGIIRVVPFLSALPARKGRRLRTQTVPRTGGCWNRDVGDLRCRTLVHSRPVPAQFSDQFGTATVQSRLTLSLAVFLQRFGSPCGGWQRGVWKECRSSQMVFCLAASNEIRCIVYRWYTHHRGKDLEIYWDGERLSAHAWLETSDGLIYDKVSTGMIDAAASHHIIRDYRRGTLLEGVSQTELHARGVWFVPAPLAVQHQIVDRWFGTTKGLPISRSSIRLRLHLPL